MRKYPKLPWKEGLAAAITLLGVGALMWLTEARFFGSAHPMVQLFGFVAFVVGCLGALAVAGFHWWSQSQEIADFDAKYGSRSDKDT